MYDIKFNYQKMDNAYVLGLMYTTIDKKMIRDIMKFYNLTGPRNTMIHNIQKWMHTSKNNDIYFWDFVRGCFEIVGNITYDNELICYFEFSDMDLLIFIANQSTIPYNIEGSRLIYRSVNVIDFLGNVYSGDHENEFVYKNNKSIFKNLLIVSDTTPKCRVVKLDPRAVVPYKTRVSDVGLDLVIIKKIKQYTSMTVLYDTGIAIHIPHGYYAEIVPRSSLSKTGYMLANNVGIIDNSYRGNLYVPLIKVDQQMPDIDLPFRCCQLIIRKQIWVDIEQVDELEITDRGSGGFGSTNLLK